MKKIQCHLVVGGVVGPATFIGAWSVSGALAPSYSPANDAISQLAALGAPTRTAMTAGFVGFGVSVPLYAVALRGTLRGPAWLALVVAGMATLGVATFPLGAPSNDLPHTAFAVTAYTAVAATPLLAIRAMSAQRRPGWVRFSVASGVLSAGFLLATTTGLMPGLFQRLGLTIADLWIMASAADLLRRH